MPDGAEEVGDRVSCAPFLDGSDCGRWCQRRGFEGDGGDGATRIISYLLIMLVPRSVFDPATRRFEFFRPSQFEEVTSDWGIVNSQKRLRREQCLSDQSLVTSH